MQDNTKVFNIKHCEFRISNISIEADNEKSYWNRYFPGVKEFVLTGLSSDGAGITPTSETKIIPGLTEEEGFSVDPKSGATITVTLKSTSSDVKKMIALYKDQREGYLAPFRFDVEVKDEFGHGSSAADAYGFKRQYVKKVMIVSFAPFETNEVEAPDYEFNMIGYGWDLDLWD